MIRLFVCVLVVGFAVPAQDLALVPWPARLAQHGGRIELPSEGGIECAAIELRPTAEALARALHLVAGADFEITTRGSIRLRIDPALAPGAYRLMAGDQVELAGGDQRGVAWAAATLAQLAERAPKGVSVPALTIEDAPALSYRGVMLDVARFWHDVAVLRATVDLCWLLKMPFLHLHLSDDQSFTFPSESLPKLPSMFGDGRRRHYTREELVELVAYAHARGVAIVPEIDVPGHASLMGRAYPEIFGRGVIDMTSERTYAALDVLFGELCEVFTTSPYLHFGADEVAADPDQYCQFIGRMCAMIRAHGKRPMAWEGFAGTGTESAPIPRDLVVMAWNLDINPADRLIAAGFEVVNCGWWPLYLVPPQNRAPTARDAYAWHPRRFETWTKPEPFVVLDEKAPLLGAQLCFWEQTAEVVLPLLRSRLPAIAERTWSPDSKRSFEDFARRAGAFDAHIAPLFEGLTAPPDARDPVYHYRFFSSPPRHSWDSMPDFAALQPDHEGVLGRATEERVRAINAATFVRVDPFGHVDTRVPDGWNPFGLELRGRVRIPSSGPCEFLLRSNDGLAELSIGDARVAWRQHPGSARHDVTRGELEAGVHRFTLRYFCREIRNELNLRVRLPGSSEAVAFESLLLPLDDAVQEFAQQPHDFVPELAPAVTSLTTGRPVRASGGTEGSMLPMLAVDGDDSNESGWHTHPYPQWLEVDLGAEHAIDRVRVVTWHDGSRHYRYVVDASPDRVSWTRIADHSANRTPATAAGIEDRFERVPARFVRIELQFNSANPGVHLSELSVWADGENRDAVTAPAPGDPRDVAVDGSVRTVRLDDTTTLRSLHFSSNIEASCTVSARRLRLEAGARIAYEHNPKVANQTIAAPLELLGDVTITNDNTWTHEAHMLRITGALSGDATLIIDGTGDGGVELSANSLRTFSGAVRIDGGMLIPRNPGGLGSGTQPITMRGGKLFLPAITLRRGLAIEGSSILWLGGSSSIQGDVDIATGASLLVDTGGGNPGDLSGTLSGAGTFELRAGSGARETPAFTLSGTAPNTFRGGVWVKSGTLGLHKPDQVTAITGRIRLGGEGLAVLRLQASEQIDDRASLVIDAKGGGILATEGHRETLGSLVVNEHGFLRCGDGVDDVHFARSADEAWREDRDFLILGFDPSEDRIRFGSRSSDLSAAQLAHIGFRDPVDRPDGTFHARARADGSLESGAAVAPRADLGFRIDRASDAAREKLYEKGGLARLTARDTRLREGDTIALFGDSITWLHGFARRIEFALALGPGTASLGVKVTNRGINGGGVRDLRDGSKGAARAHGLPGGPGNDPQAPFTEVLAEDHPAAVVILIGINDVNWRGTTPEQFEDALRTLCRQARAASARVVLATLMLKGERPDGTNPNDAAIDDFAEITRRVARDERAELVDLRAATIAWLRNNNRRLRLDGSIDAADSGLLTYDGIHLSDLGNDLVAELLADGLARVLRGR